MTSTNSTNLPKLDELLKIDDENVSTSTKAQTQSNLSAKELPEFTETKHTVTTSPWSRLLIIALPFGFSFLVIFWFLNGIFNPSSRQAIKSVEKPQNPSEASEKVDQKDGDIYATLALSKQQEELSKINNRSQQPKTLPEVKQSKTPKVVSASPPPPQTTRSTTSTRLVSVQQNPRTNNRTTNSTTQRPMREALTNVSQSKPVATTTPTQQALDPTSEFDRLRSYGSFGDIAYVDTSEVESSSPSDSEFKDKDPAQFTDPAQRFEQVNNVQQENATLQPQETTPGSIDKIVPRWQVETKTTKVSTVASNYLQQENQILNERQIRYLTVGEFASGIMVTPAIKQETNSRNPQQSNDNKRFVAKLTEDLHDNYRNVAIPANTLVAIELVSVDGGSYATVEVTSIIKDNTEYPISKGAISVLGAGGKPLIAKKFQDKGGEIAQYDITLGLVSGLGKIGETLNQSDTTTIINSSSNSYSSSSSSSSRRDIGGAFLEGAFDKLTDIIGKRTETANTEIAARPNVWYIAKDTPVTFIVNRTLELP